jgi:uncharacterized repeat protein (TIGR03803 family)
MTHLNPVYRRFSLIAGVIATLLAISVAGGQASYEKLHSFKTGPQNPFGSLIHGSGGYVYGTTVYGGRGIGTVFKMKSDGSSFALLRSFSDTDGAFPWASLIQSADNYLYGTTESGGENGAGTIFRLKPDGSSFATIHSFNFDTDGAAPRAALIQPGDGYFYGTTTLGGPNGAGTVFRIKPDGSEFTVLQAFGNDANGSEPAAPLMAGSGGFLYGTTQYGGLYQAGTVFRIKRDGSSFGVLRSFDYYGTDGAYPYAGLVQSDDGYLYGTTQGGGSNGAGTVFRIKPNGSSFSVLRSFSYDTDGANPTAALLPNGDGYLYGTTPYGGLNATGSVFRLKANGSSFTVLRHLNLNTDGTTPSSALIRGPGGYLYGTAQLGGPTQAGTIFKLKPNGTAFTVLPFPYCVDGCNPVASVVSGQDGYLYGTTLTGGPTGSGTVFKIKPDGSSFSLLHSFSYTDGAGPASMILLGDGYLYGTTGIGGQNGNGTLFRLKRDGSSFAVLYSFLSETDGAGPSSLLQGSDGYLSGTTSGGGGLSNGTIFKVKPNGTEFNVLHHFFGGAQGHSPLIQIGDYFYGTSRVSAGFGGGAIFRIKLDGSSYSELRLFDFTADGSSPSAALINAGDGYLYGTTQFGGANGAGTVFRLQPDGSLFEVIYSFNFDSDGAYPSAPLFQGGDGYFYGTTQYGGPDGAGTVFKVSADGTEFRVLHPFEYFVDGGNPYSASLIKLNDGYLYGTTPLGGPGGAGTVYRLGPLP